MTSTPLVVIDACVLVNFALCDTLLRLAEPPRLFDAKWTEEIIREATRTLESRLQWPSSLIAHFEAELRVHFSEAWVNGHEPLIPRMTNDEKDRHVTAAAVHAGAPLILTFNLRHFKPEHLAVWGITAQHPQSFLSEMLRQDQILVISKLKQQAADRGRSLRELLHILNATVPEFVSAVSGPISWEQS